MKSCQLALQPSEVWAACAMEHDDKCLVRAGPLGHGVPVVPDRAIAIEQTAGHRKEERVRDRDRPDRQALTWSDADRDQPLEQRPIAELGSVRGLPVWLELHTDLHGLADALHERLDQLSILVGKGDRAAAKAPVSPAPSRCSAPAFG